MNTPKTTAYYINCGFGTPQNTKRYAAVCSWQEKEEEE